MGEPLTKPIPFEAIMLLTETQIAERFPKGAVEEKKRWRPARTKKEAHKSLARLLAEKRKRVHGKRLLGKTHGYTENPAFALYTRPDPGEAIDEVSQGEYSKGAGQYDAFRKAATRRQKLEAEQKELKAMLETRRTVAQERGINIRSDVRVIERRLQEIDRKLEKEAA